MIRLYVMNPKILALQATLILSLSIPAWSWAAYRHADEPIGTVEQIYDGALLPDEAVNTFRNIDRLFPTRTVAASTRPCKLEQSSYELKDFTADIDGKKYDINDYFALNSITGMVVLKDGRLVYEKYQHGNGPDTRWMSMSVAKSITSTLVGAAIKDGYIDSLDDNVVQYVPRLKGSAYDGVTVGQVLGMNSGVDWNETYTDPDSDRRHLLKAQLAQKPGALMDVMSNLSRAGEPGSMHNYSTGETQVAGEIVIGATGKTLSQYLHDKIWQPYGMESDAKWWLAAKDGHEIGGSGLAATARDFARFGQFFLDGGRIDGQSILPDGWLEKASTPTELTDGKTVNYGLMWWPAWTESSKEHGAFQARGIQGQAIHIDPRANVVIVVTAAQSKPDNIRPIDNMAFFDALIPAIQKKKD